jgi:hypothetical protein
MSTIYKRRSLIKLPACGGEAENEEYWIEHKGMVLCPGCGNVHFKKRWYASMRDVLSRKSVLRSHSKIEGEQLCQACKMIRNHEFEGELFLENFPRKTQTELLRLIRSYGARAIEADPQDRIIEIQKFKKKFRVTTTENQLADRMAKKVRDSFKKVRLHFSHSREPFEVDRIHAIYSLEKKS